MIGFATSLLRSIISSAVLMLGAAAAVLPLVTLFAAAVLDQDSKSGPRWTAFHLALGASDPAVWDAIWTSTLMAVTVGILSYVIGLSLSRLLTRRRFLGRPPLLVLALVPMIVSPWFGAMGLAWVLSRSGPVVDLVSQLRLEAELLPWLNDWGAWMAWGWLGVTWGSTVVCLAARASLLRVDGQLVEAGTALGGTPNQVWHAVVAPMVKPSALRAAGWVAACWLIEPGPPLILGLERTLPSQILQQLWNGTDVPRLAVLGVFGLSMAIGLQLIGSMIALRWRSAELDKGSSPKPRPRTLGLIGTLASWIILSLFIVVALIPLLGLVGSAVLQESRALGLGQAVSADSFLALTQDIELRNWASQGAFLGICVAGLVAIQTWGRSTAVESRAWRFLSSLPLVVGRGVPPLLLALGVWLLGFACPWLNQEVPTSVQGRTLESWVLMVRSVGWEVRQPSTQIIWVALLCVLHQVAWSSSMVKEMGDRSSRVEAALLTGASRRKANALSRVGSWSLPRTLAACVAAVLFTSCVVAPALIWMPWPEGRTLATGVVVSWDQAGLRRQAAALGCCLVLAQAAFALVQLVGAAKRRP